MNKTFFRFLFGFTAIIGIALAGAVVAEVYSKTGGVDIKELIANFFK